MKLLAVVEHRRDVGSLSIPTTDLQAVVALTPAARAAASARGLPVESTQPSFPADAHARLLERSAPAIGWLREQAQPLADSHRVSVEYRETLVWYTRWVVHYCLWLCEVLDGAVSRHDVQRLVTPPANVIGSGQYLRPEESYLGEIASRYAVAHGLEFLAVDSGKTRGAGRLRSRFREMVLGTGALAVWPLHAVAVRRLRESGPLLFTNRTYRLSAIADGLRRETGRPVAVFVDRPSLGGLLGKATGTPFSLEIWLRAFDAVAHEDRASRDRLAAATATIGDAVLRDDHGLFRHRGVLFADLVARKLRDGIIPLVLRLHRRTAAIASLMRDLDPAMVVSVGDRDDDAATAELCSLAERPAIIVPHGSYASPSDDAETAEWSEHGSRMIRLPFPYVAVQSPLASEYLDNFPSASTRVVTGPLVWCSVSRARTVPAALALRIGHKRIVLHAGTGKPHFSLRFHVYETMDEYLASIADLAKAVETRSDTVLVVKFRPTPWLTLEDLRALIPLGPNVVISVDDPLSALLASSNLVVSFSSTVIEEALQSSVPVLLYGGGGRYCHVPDAVELPQPDGRCPQVAAYHVRMESDLRSALSSVLDAWPDGIENSDVFERYKSPVDGRINIKDLISSDGQSMPPKVPVQAEAFGDANQRRISRVG
jgi:hypothetical protein